MTKIMLVEDDNNLREIYGARLSAEGYDIVFAQDGEEALALAVKEKPDLIVSDVMMPKISGFDMLDILRNAPETKDTKVIMMTALSQAEDQERAERLGADKYLVKSQVTLEDVVKTIKEVLGETTPQTQDSSQPTQAADNAASTDPNPTAVPTPGLAAQSTDVAVTTPEPTPSIPTSESSVGVASSPESSSNAVETAPQPPMQEPTAEEQPTQPQDQPTPENSPSVNPAPTTQATDDSTTNQPSTPTPIAVTLPDDPTTPQSDGIAQVTDPSTTQPPAQDNPTPEPTPETPQIGPNLNEALHNAEDEIKEEIRTMESPTTTASSAPAVANGGEVPQVVEPASEPQPEPAQVNTQPIAPEQPPQPAPVQPDTPTPVSASPTSPTPAPPTEPPVSSVQSTPEPTAPEPTQNSGITEDQSGKKTINPINDLSSKPDLNELLAKEQAQSGIENPPVSSVITPTGEVSSTPATSQTGNSSETDLTSVETKESPITPAPAPSPDNKDDIAL